MNEMLKNYEKSSSRSRRSMRKHSKKKTGGSFNNKSRKSLK